MAESLDFGIGFSLMYLIRRLLYPRSIFLVTLHPFYTIADRIPVAAAIAIVLTPKFCYI
jgi:hypothetical protein